MNLVVKYGIILFVSLVGISGQILLKKGLAPFSGLNANQFLFSLHKVLFSPIILMALSCYVVGMLAYLFLLSKVELTSVYPIYTAFIVMGVTIAGSWGLKETVSWPEIGGILLIITGVFIVEKFGGSL